MVTGRGYHHRWTCVAIPHVVWEPCLKPRPETAAWKRGLLGELVEDLFGLRKAAHLLLGIQKLAVDDDVKLAFASDL